jgi:RNA polymerase sigma factor (sigma-70 family)
MGDAPITRPSLLIRIRDPKDAEAWSQFVDLYGPVVYQFSRKRGLQDADAADLTQTVLQALSREIRRWDYDTRRGLFRGWLFALVRNQFHKFLYQRRHLERGSGDTDAHRLLAQQPAPEGDEEQLWEQEYRRRLLHWAADNVRDSFEESSWQAFWQTAVAGEKPKDVAARLGMTVGAVYMAKSRVLDRIKREIEQLQDEEERPAREQQ